MVLKHMWYSINQAGLMQAMVLLEEPYIKIRQTQQAKVVLFAFCKAIGWKTFQWQEIR